jgi:ATP-dependent Clp protease ATP-binding subunit ClpA
VSGKRLVGNVVLELERDGAICKLIADEGYDPDQGARSLQNAVESRIGDALVQAYLDEEGQIDDSLPMTKYRVSLARNGTLLVVKVTDNTEEEDSDDAGDQDFPMLRLLSMINGT